MYCFEEQLKIFLFVRGGGYQGHSQDFCRGMHNFPNPPTSLFPPPSLSSPQVPNLLILVPCLDFVDDLSV